MTRLDGAMEGVLGRIARALGRETPPARVPDPPAIDERIARFTGTREQEEIVGEFVRVATESAKMTVREVGRRTLAAQVAAILRERQARRVVLTRSGLVAELDLASRLSAEGFEAVWWSQTTLDETYKADAGITNVWFAVAETGSLVIRASAEHGRAVSLVPPLHIAILERSQIVPDLIDAMAKISAEGAGSATVFITGPSKTSDIELTLVTGVHGPMEVVVLLVASIE